MLNAGGRRADSLGERDLREAQFPAAVGGCFQPEVFGSATKPDPSRPRLLLETGPARRDAPARLTTDLKK